jgi:hypothetical protein
LPLPRRHWYIRDPDAPVVASLKVTERGTQPAVAVAVKSAFNAADALTVYNNVNNNGSSRKLDFKNFFLIGQSGLFRAILSQIVLLYYFSGSIGCVDNKDTDFYNNIIIALPSNYLYFDANLLFKVA